MITAGQNDPESKPRSIQHSFTEGILPNGILSHRQLSAHLWWFRVPAADCRRRAALNALASASCSHGHAKLCARATPKLQAVMGGQPGEGSQGRGPQGQASGPVNGIGQPSC